MKLIEKKKHILALSDINQCEDVIKVVKNITDDFLMKMMFEFSFCCLNPRGRKIFFYLNSKIGIKT